MSAYVEPILKLLIEKTNIDIFVNLDRYVERISISINKIINTAKNTVFTDLSNKKDRRLLVK